MKRKEKIEIDRSIEPLIVNIISIELCLKDNEIIFFSINSEQKFIHVLVLVCVSIKLNYCSLEPNSCMI